MFDFMHHRLVSIGLICCFTLLLASPGRAADHRDNTITTIDQEKGLVSAMRKSDNQSFTFEIKDSALLQSLRVGQAVDVDLQSQSITVDIPQKLNVQNLKLRGSASVGNRMPARPAAPAGLEGESKDGGHKDEIDVLSASPGEPAAVGSAARASTKKGRGVGGEEQLTENVTLNVTGSAARASTQRTPGGPGADIRASEGDTAMAIRGRPATQPAGRAFTIVPNPELKGRLGRLVVVFPESAKPSGTRINIYKAGEEKAIGGAYGGIAAELMPGKYSVEISNQRLNDIEVQSKNDTTIHVGVLRISAGGDTRLDVLAADGETKLTGGYGEQVIGLPIGIYHLQVAGASEPVTIQKDQVTDF